MTAPSVEASYPPTQVDLIASWGAQHGTWLENRGNGHAAVSMWVDDGRQTVALVDYGETTATTDVRWNRTGTLALEQYRRDAWDTQFYKEIAQWLKAKAAS